MSLILIPLLPLSMPYFTLISSKMSFSLVLSSRYCFVFYPSVGTPVIVAMRSTLIGTGLSIHKMPPFTLANNCLTHPFMCFSHLKCVMYNKFMMPMLYSPRIHYACSNSGADDGPSPMLSRYLFGAKYGNFMASETSWLEYLRLSTPPTMLSSVFTPLGIFGITIANSSYTRCTPCVLLSARALFFPCGDNSPPSGTTSCSVS
jgi:hypothetical protein